MFIGCNEGPAAAGIQLAGSDAHFSDGMLPKIDRRLPVARCFISRNAKLGLMKFLDMRNVILTASVPSKKCLWMYLGRRWMQNCFSRHIQTNCERNLLYIMVIKILLFLEIITY